MNDDGRVNERGMGQWVNGGQQSNLSLSIIFFCSEKSKEEDKLPEKTASARSNLRYQVISRGATERTAISTVRLRCHHDYYSPAAGPRMR